MLDEETQFIRQHSSGPINPFSGNFAGAEQNNKPQIPPLSPIGFERTQPIQSNIENASTNNERKNEHSKTTRKKKKSTKRNTTKKKIRRKKTVSKETRVFGYGFSSEKQVIDVKQRCLRRSVCEKDVSWNEARALIKLENIERNGVNTKAEFLTMLNQHAGYSFRLLQKS